MKDAINLLYVFDDAYAPHAGISMTSLLENHNKSDKTDSKDRIRFFCAGMNVSESNRSKLEQTVNRYDQELNWIDTSDAQRYMTDLNVGEWNGSRATWLKILVLWDIPQDVEFLLYIDSDTVITDDISSIRDLYPISDDHPVCMAYDSLGNSRGKKQFGLEEYYNAGVILFNMRRWREPHFKEGFFTHIEDHSHEYYDNEQGLLNDFFRDQIALLPLRYNMQGFLRLFDETKYFSVYNDFPFYSAREIREAKASSIIQHFFRVFGQYPWEKGNLHPCRGMYEEWREKSLWADHDPLSEKNPNKVDPVFYIERMLYKILPEKAYLHIYRSIVERGI